MTTPFHNITSSRSECWLPCASDCLWLARYLHTVHLPAAAHPVKTTLCAEITTLREQVIYSETSDCATLSFNFADDVSMKAEHYTITLQENVISIDAGGWPGLLYAWYHLLRNSESPNVYPIIINEKPAFAIRMINHWDNMDGTIERGYAGDSFFFRDNHICYDSDRLHQYARLLASIGINAIAINNVNVHHHETALIDEALLPDVSHLAAIFRQYAIRFFLSINFASPVETGELATADPLDASVMGWWQRRAQQIYHSIPDFGGYIVKADSEHRPGPFTYQRTHADGANMLARTLAPWGGISILALLRLQLPAEMV